jgi:hypothetical protein
MRWQGHEGSWREPRDDQAWFESNEARIKNNVDRVFYIGSTHTDCLGDNRYRYRYMYMNRLRHDDFVCLFAETGNTIKRQHQHQDQSTKVEAILENKLLFLDDRFKYKNNDILSTTGAWFILERG